jgi:predicted dehydrogenase
LGSIGAQDLLSSPLYNVLIIGCGNIAGGFDIAQAMHSLPLSHAGAYIQHGGFRLLACVDPDDDRRRVYAKHWSVEKHVANLTELVHSPGTFDVISICSPTSLHHEHVVSALALCPKVIFCEKPLTYDIRESEQLVRDCRTQSVTLAVNYSRRWDPSIDEVIGQLKGNHWGVVRSVVGHYNKGIINNGSHMVDLLLRLVGPLELVSVACVEFDFWDSDPTVAALLTASNGSVPVYLNPGNARDFAFFELEIVCELGVLRMHSGGMDWKFREAVPSTQFMGYRTLETGNQLKGRYLESMTLAIDNIYDHLCNGALIESTGEQAIQVQKLCMQIQREALMKCMPLNKK